MDDLERRILTVEHTIASDRQLTQLHLSQLHQRLEALEAHPLRSINPGMIFRILMAVVLPIIVWLATGDMAKALRAVIR